MSPPFVRCSLLKKFVIAVFCTLPVCVWVPPALAQHPAAPLGRPAGGAHTYASPVSQGPIVHTPIFHPAMSAPRMSAAPSAGLVGRIGFRPPLRPIRPFPPVFVVYGSRFALGGPCWRSHACCWSATCDFLWPWPLEYTTISSPGPTNYVLQVYQTPVYVYGDERPDLPQLFLKDGTVLNVTDYWRVDDQLHFAMIEEYGTKPAEHVIPFDALDLQMTIDANTRRGFRFVLRNEPLEQYLRDHP